ncbi:MAG: glutamate 5-kinase [Deltaproteobacteria bacterium]|nr:glutamate 5-kinase [Deltaproteobacteria bacterium]
MTRKEILAGAKRVLIKIGSAVLSGENGLDLQIIEQLVDEMAQLKKKGYQIVIVTSGAIASGKHRMGISGKLKSMPQKQAAAAIGQGRLMRVYSNAFGKYGLYVAQILLTMSDLTDRKRFLNIRNTLSTLIEWGVIAVINENDSVAVDEIKFGDNDHLAAMITNTIEAHLLINLTSTEGLYDRNPSGSKKAKLISLVKEFTKEIESAATEETTPIGMGGMKSKVLAAKKVTAFGIPCIIAPGRRKGVLHDIFAGKEIGTLFLPTSEHLSSRKHWIAFTLRSRGKLIIDEGAKKALLEEGKSLLPSGVVGVEGDFAIGDPVTCVDMEGITVAKGLANYGAPEIRKIMGVKSSRIEQILGYKDYDEIIHRDNLAITRESIKP